MNKKWSSDKVKEVQRFLIKRWPESFAQGPDLRPLSLQVHKEILKHRDENPQLSGRVVSEVLNRHTNSFGYLYGLLKNEFRYDLENKPVAEVAPEHREWARQTLRAKQKLAQKIRKDARQKLRDEKKAQHASQKALSRTVHKNAPSESGASSPVIKYKPARRRIIKPADQRTVDLAS